MIKSDMTCYHSEQLTKQSANTSNADVINASEFTSNLRKVSQIITTNISVLNRVQIKISASPIIFCT